jgi:hypothetical protein
LNPRQRSLAIAAIASVCSAAIVAFGPGLTALRLPFALLLLFVLPGYTLVAGLFPDESLDGPRGLVLTLGLSVALAVLTGLILDLGPDGVTTDSWAVALSMLTCLAALIGVASTDRYGAISGSLRFRARPRELALLVVGAAILGTAVGFSRTVLPARNVRGYTALWIQPARLGARAGVRIGAISGELAAMRFRLTLRVGGQLRYEKRFVLQPGGRYKQLVPLGAPPTDSAEPIRATLYRQARPNVVFRTVTLRLSDVFPSW